MRRFIKLSVYGGGELLLDSRYIRSVERIEVKGVPNYLQHYTMIITDNQTYRVTDTIEEIEVKLK